MIYVLYHRDKDGQGAAYCAWRKFGDRAKYISVQYGEEMPLMDQGSEVYIVDFSFKRDVLKGLADVMDKVVVIDHHKTAMADLEGFEHEKAEIHFKMELSGAVLSWFHFIGNDTAENPPKLIEHIQDRDLWKFRMKGTTEVHEFLCSFSYNPALWDYFVRHMSIEEIYKQGSVLIRSRDRMVSNLAKNAYRITFEDHRVITVNSPVYTSELAHHLLGEYRDCHLAMVTSELEGRKIHSLYSRNSDDIDVSVLAKKHGGGGHTHAAGFVVTT